MVKISICDQITKLPPRHNFDLISNPYETVEFKIQIDWQISF